MARLLDHIATPRKPESLPNAEEKVKIASAEMDADEGDNDSVPFIEIGGPAVRTRPSPERAARPAIIPMPRAEIKAEEPRPITITGPTYYQVSFQPLPFRRSSGLPQEKQMPAELVAFHQ